MRAVIFIAISAHIVLGNLCMMPAVYAAESTDAHHHIASNETSVSCVQHAEPRENHVYHNASSDVSCKDGHCLTSPVRSDVAGLPLTSINDYPITFDQPVQSATMQFFFPATTPRGTAPRLTAFMPAMIVLRC